MAARSPIVRERSNIWKEKESIWNEIWGQTDQCEDKGAGGAHLFVFGTIESSKHELLEMLQRCTKEVAPPTSEQAVGGIDFSYLQILDHDKHPAGWASVWIQEDPEYTPLMQARLNEVSVAQLLSSVAVVVLNLQDPWDTLPELQAWMETLQTLTQARFEELSLEDQDRLRAKVAKNVKTPISYNLGIPLVVVVTRAESAGLLETDREKTGWLEVIQYHLRTTCLLYGAALVYVGEKGDAAPNTQALYNDLMNKIAGFDLPVDSKSSLTAAFIKSGEDTQEAVQRVIASSGISETAPFESIIAAPPSRQPLVEEVKLETMQDFLGEERKTLSAPQKPKARKAPEIGRQEIRADPKKAPQDTQSLNLFFQNLLRKKPEGAPIANKSSLTTDMRKELTRLKEKSKEKSASSVKDASP